MAEKISYGLVGAGMMGQEHIRNIALLPDAGVAAILEPDAAMRAEAARLAPDATQVETLEALMSVPGLSCIVIASPNHVHVDQLIEIAARGTPLPVLVEKPLYTLPEDAARLDRLQAAYPAPVWVAMEYRYMPPIAALAAEAEAATGGIRMLTIREHRFPFLAKVGDWNRFNRFTGGTLVEKCCHFFDLMRLLLKAEPVRVMASAGQDVNHLQESYAPGRPDIWDNGFALVDFDTGARAMLELCMFAEGSRFQEHISAMGPVGKIDCRVPGPTRFWPADLGPAPVAELETSPREPRRPRKQEIPVDPGLLAAGDHNGATFYQHLRFAGIVRAGGAPEVSLADGRAAVEMGLAAQRSAETGEAVRLRPRCDASGAPPRRAMHG